MGDTVDDIIRSAQGPAGRQIELNAEVLRELQRATELHIVLMTWPEREYEEDDDGVVSPVVVWRERYVAWFLAERDALDWAEAQRLLTSAKYAGRARRTMKLSDCSWPRDATFAVRAVESQIALFADAETAFALCEKLSEVWAQRAESIRRRILERAGV